MSVRCPTCGHCVTEEEAMRAVRAVRDASRGRRRGELLDDIADAQGPRRSGARFRSGARSEREAARGALRAAQAGDYGATVKGRWFVTPHAVRRFIERMRPRASYAQALDELCALSEKAHLVKADGDVEHWRCGLPQPIRFRVAKGTGGVPALVTVLPPWDGWDDHDGGER